MTLDRPVTIVTGATSGIGAAIAETLCQKGHAVVIVGRSLEAGAALEDRLKTAGGSALFLAEDLSDRTAPDRIAAATQTFGGQIDALVNNAGLLRNGTAPETSDDDWDAVLDLNLSAAFRMSRAVLPQMQAQGQGSILNVASDWAPMGARGGCLCRVQGRPGADVPVQRTGSRAGRHSRQCDLSHRYGYPDA